MLKMRAARRRLSSCAVRTRVWVDINGRYGPDIRGCTNMARLIRIKHHKPGFRFGGKKLSPRLFKVRGLPKNWMEIARASDFSPYEKYPGVWDIFDRDAGDRHRDFHRTKRMAWLTCYHAAVDRAAANY